MAKAVLVVEDDPSTLSGYVEYLTSAGFLATGFADAERALAVACDSPPAAVVTDITMPGMDGFALAKALHQDTRTRHVPVIGLTANWYAEVKTRAAAAAMRTVLLKPCSPAHLVAELERVLHPAVIRGKSR
jgi:CheY-like chemotaxis protein